MLNKDNKNLPLVSVVITTKNEERNIENCVKSIECQTYLNIEIIVVDNNSEDRTKELARKHTKLVFNKGPERSTQRNFGMIEKSNGKYVMFIDCDMILSPNLVRECVSEIQNKKYVALHIPEIVLGSEFWSKVRCFERSFYNGTLIDGARFFDKQIFQEVGGFDESMSGPEDWDIDKRMKQKGKIGLINVPESTSKWQLKGFVSSRGIDPSKYGVTIYHNEAEFEVKKYLQKKGYYATSFDNYINKWGKNDPDIKKQLGLKYRYFKVFLEKGKWLNLISHPVLSLGMGYLRFAVGMKFLFRKKLGKVESPYKKMIE